MTASAIAVGAATEVVGNSTNNEILESDAAIDGITCGVSEALGGLQIIGKITAINSDRNRLQEVFEGEYNTSKLFTMQPSSFEYLLLIIFNIIKQTLQRLAPEGFKREWKDAWKDTLC
ncbi:4541_t:CDS:2, partial [Dentiscutata heterogama]